MCGKTSVRVVLVTVPDPSQGVSLARTLVEEGLAACGTVVGGAVSVYRWKGSLHEDREALVVFKAAAAGVEELIRRVVELHPYEVPEVLALPVEEGYPPYLAWVLEEGGG